MEMVAGNKGWSNSISWILMLEDTAIIQNFAGKELAVTTGLGFHTEDKLKDIAKYNFKNTDRILHTLVL